MNHPVVSIVLPCYNGARYLAQAIGSCRAQSFTEWELIIVDDASTDETPAIIASYAAMDSRIRPLRHDRNRKLPAALNTGFAAARGEFFTWTSDDNCYHPEALARMLEALEAQPGCGVVYTDYRLIDEDGALTGTMVVPDPCHLVFGNCIGPSFLYRRAVQEALCGYDEGFFLVEDYDFWLRASLRFVMKPLHEVLYDYRQHNGSLTAQREREILAGHRKVFLRSIDRMRWLSRRARALGLIRLSRSVRYCGDWKGANAILLKALATAPLAASGMILDMLRRGPAIIQRPPYDDPSW